MLTFRDEIFFLLTHFWSHDHALFTFNVLTECHITIDLSNDCSFFRLPSFEKLGNARKTARDIFRFRSFTVHFCNHVSRVNFLSVSNEKLSPNGDQITGRNITTW